MDNYSQTNATQNVCFVKRVAFRMQHFLPRSSIRWNICFLFVMLVAIVVLNGTYGTDYILSYSSRIRFGRVTSVNASRTGPPSF